MHRDVSQLLAGDFELRAALDEDSPTVVDLFASVLKTAEGNFIGGLRSIDLGAWRNALLEE
jgi:hypothetical protein